MHAFDTVLPTLPCCPFFIEQKFSLECRKRNVDNTDSTKGFKMAIYFLITTRTLYFKKCTSLMGIFCPHLTFQVWIYFPWSLQCYLGNNYSCFLWRLTIRLDMFAKEWQWACITWSFPPSFGPMSWLGICTRPLAKRPFSRKSAPENTSNPTLFMRGEPH